MREYLRKNPPEKTAQYKKNMRFKKAEFGVLELESAYVERDDNCCGLKVGTKVISTELPSPRIKLRVIRSKSKLQILYALFSVNY